MTRQPDDPGVYASDDPLYAPAADQPLSKRNEMAITILCVFSVTAAPALLCAYVLYFIGSR